MFEHVADRVLDFKLYRLVGDDLTLSRSALAKALGTDAPLTQGPFPTPLPVTLSQGKLHEVAAHKNAFLVCEKTDGMRFLLFMTRLKGIKILLLVNRRYDMYILDMKTAFSKAESGLFDNHGTILDGELVKPMRESKLRFYLFDAIMMAGEHLGTMSLPDRLARVVTILYAKLAQAQPSSASKHAAAGAIELHVKTYFRIDNCLDDFLRHYQAVQREVPIDGIIISPVSLPIAPGRNFHLLKWKQAADQTVDFVYLGKGVLSVFDNGHLKQVASLANHKYTEAATDISALDHMHASMAGGRNSTAQLVVECAYDPAIMGWKYVRHRTDKNQGNNMRTYVATLESIRSPLTLQDIVSAFKGPTGSSRTAASAVGRASRQGAAPRLNQAK